MKQAAHLPVRANASSKLQGEVYVPGDKSVSHRSLILGGLAEGKTSIAGLLPSDDVRATAAAMAAFGATIDWPDEADSLCTVVGTSGRIGEPTDVLDMGNSGTSARLLMGVAAGGTGTVVMNGDASLRKRPMGRVMTPLQQMGAHFMARSNGYLPLAIRGSGRLEPVTYHSPVASAQVKSAILLAGLSCAGPTTVIEPAPTRDHSERMLSAFGADIQCSDLDDGKRRVTLMGGTILKADPVTVPGDISSAAFVMVAGVLCDGSYLTLRNVGLNPGRTGIIDCLQEMGADLTIINERTSGGEPVGDIEIKTSDLTGINVPRERVPSMIDEFPILAMAAACASGTTRFDGIGELRVKESDRLGAIASGLAACGVKVEEERDALVIHGLGGVPAGGAHIQARLDHRIAMSFLVLGLVSKEPITIDDASPINTSFPGFIKLMQSIGADLSPLTQTGDTHD